MTTSSDTQNIGSDQIESEEGGGMYEGGKTSNETKYASEEDDEDGEEYEDDVPPTNNSNEMSWGKSPVGLSSYNRSSGNIALVDLVPKQSWVRGLDNLCLPWSTQYKYEASRYDASQYATLTEMLESIEATGQSAGYRSRTRQRKKGRAKVVGQRSMISTLSICPPGTEWGGLLAAGSYADEIGLYDIHGGCQLGMILRVGEKGKRNPTGSAQMPKGVTQVEWGRDGRLLFVGYRRKHGIDVWDIRQPKSPLATLDRSVSTNQHLRFDIDQSGKYLYTGTYLPPCFVLVTFSVPS